MQANRFIQSLMSRRDNGLLTLHIFRAICGKLIHPDCGDILLVVKCILVMQFVQENVEKLF